MNENSKNEIWNIADKYALSSIKTRLDATEESVTAKVAFLGEFSSGKTSLINAIAGTKLPVDTKPTTKAICIIRAAKDGDATQARYFRQTAEGSEEEISWMDFDEAVQSEGAESALAVEVPPGEWIPDGVEIIDTPGEGSLGVESSITMAYLTQTDAAVFCTSVSDGTLHKRAINFLSAPALRRVHGRIVFAVTMADLRTATTDGVCDADRIRNNIVTRLKELEAEGKFDATDIEKRVLLVSVKDMAGGKWGPAALLNSVKRFIYAKSADIAAERRDDAIKSIAKEAAELLKFRCENETLDLSGLDKRLSDTEGKMRDAREKVDELKHAFAGFRDALPERLGNVFDGFVPSLVNLKSEEEIASVSGQMADKISEAVSRLARLKLGDESFTIDRSFDAQLRAALPAALARIDKTVRGLSDLAFVAASAGLAAAVSGGATAAGGAARGAAAVAAKAGAKTASAASRSAKTAAAVAAKTAAETAKSSEWLGKTAMVLSKVLDSLNPFSYVADWVSPNLKENVVSGFRAQLIGHADAISDLIWEEYEGFVIKPAVQALEDRRAAVKEAQEAIESGKKDFLAARDGLAVDIERLSAIANG